MIESTDENSPGILIAWTVSVLLHLLLLLFFSFTGKMFIKPPQFAIAPSREIDVNLIDEPQEAVQVQQQKGSEKITPKHLNASKQALLPSSQVKVAAKPDYIQNPPPPYPELARQMRQEGIVMLSVEVNKDGDPVNIEIIQSSGFHLLDQAALKAVRLWRFEPGRIGDIPVESVVRVPVRFRLEQ